MKIFLGIAFTCILACIAYSVTISHWAKLDREAAIRGLSSEQIKAMDILREQMKTLEKGDFIVMEDGRICWVESNLRESSQLILKECDESKFYLSYESWKNASANWREIKEIAFRQSDGRGHEKVFQDFKNMQRRYRYRKPL